jgi:hypothetical protein
MTRWVCLKRLPEIGRHRLHSIAFKDIRVNPSPKVGFLIAAAIVASLLLVTWKDWFPSGSQHSDGPQASGASASSAAQRRAMASEDPALAAVTGAGLPRSTGAGLPSALASSQGVANWGDRIRDLVASGTPLDLGEALGLISICRQQAEVRQSFDRYAARTAVDPKRLQAVAESLHQTEAACQTIAPSAIVDAQALALRFYESGSTGAAALVAREYPELAARLPPNEFFGQMKKDAYAGDESSIGLLAKSKPPGMPHEELVGFGLAQMALADEGTPSAGGKFGRLFREAVGAVSPEAQRVSAALLEAVAQARRKANGR